MDLGPPPYAPVPKDITSKHFPIVTLILSLVITVLGISTTVLAYQNIRLQKQVDTLLQKKLTPTPFISPSPVQPISPTEAQMMCGGIAGIKCPDGYVCQTTATYPDASGTCIKENTLTCPKNDYVDCMPSVNAGVRYECTPEAMSWYKAHCPNFKGGAL